MITFTISDRADALYYFNALASGRVVSGSYAMDGKTLDFSGLVLSIEEGNAPDVWHVTVRVPSARNGSSSTR